MPTKKTKKTTKKKIDKSYVNELLSDFQKKIPQLQKQFESIWQKTPMANLSLQMPLFSGKQVTGSKRRKKSQLLQQLSEISTVQKIQDMGQKGIRYSQDMLHKGITPILNNLHIPSRSEVKKLEMQIKELEKQIASMQSDKSTSTSKTAYSGATSTRSATSHA